MRAYAVILLALPGLARAEEPPAPEIDARVENRLVQKRDRFDVSAGAAWLMRNDFYRHPGLALGAGYWIREWVSAEVVGDVYASVETDELKQVRMATGFVPDSRKERGALMGGGRISLAYGKLLFGHHVLRFDPQWFLHAGVHFAENNVGPMGDTGLSLAMWPSARFQVRLDMAFVVQREARTDWVTVLGFQPALSLGFLL
jgi:hypothetical protein